MAQALYRKYRSRSLGEVIGQEHITRTLERALKAGRISHAYLLTGPRGSGKTSIARILAFMINDLPYSDSPNLDIIEIDAASNRRIDDIRDLREKVHIAPVSAKYKVYIIDEVHMLTGESFNALLKTLEEPPSHVVFILATTEAHKLPATIISRTQRFAFRLVERDKVAAHLRSIADAENINIDDDALNLVAEHGEGSFRDSVSLLDQLSHVSADKITAADVEKTLGLAPKKEITALVTALSQHNPKDLLATIHNLTTNNYAVSSIVSQVSKALTTLAPKQPELYALLDKLVEVPRSYLPELKLLSTLMTFADDGDDKRKNAPALSAPTPVMASTPLSEVKAAQKQQKKEQEAAREEPTQPADPPEQTNEHPLTEFDLTHWAAVLNAVKKASAPLFSVAKQALPVFDAESHTLTLKFKYNLHSKKLDDAKQKAALASIIQATLGATPVIKVEIDKTVTPPVLSTDPVVSSVAAIMGGGEVVDAQTI